MSDSQQPENRCRPSRVHWVTLSLASVSLVLIGYNSQRLLTVSPSDVSDGARTALPGCAAAGIQVPGLRESLSNTSWKPTPLGRIAICTYSSGKELNFGDDIGLPLVERMLGRRFQLPWINLAARRNGLQHCLLPIGSVLHFARAGDYGWSIGMLGEQKLRRKLPNNLTLHAIRGPETRRHARALPLSRVQTSLAAQTRHLFCTATQRNSAGPQPIQVRRARNQADPRLESRVKRDN